VCLADLHDLQESAPRFTAGKKKGRCETFRKMREGSKDKPRGRTSKNQGNRSDMKGKTEKEATAHGWVRVRVGM